MKYDFDQVINRCNTACSKWDGVEGLYGEKGLLPFWIADMDFVSSKPVIEAMKKAVEHGIFGYPVQTEAYREAVCGWMQRRFQWTVKPEWLHHSPGVVAALSFIVQAYTQPGDKVVIQTPVYYPFTAAVTKNGRQLLHNPLKREGQRYTMDFDNLRKTVALGAKMLILCSPHNPVGRVWQREELVELGEICRENNVLVVADEIHADLVLPGYTHTPFAAISEEFAQHCVVCTAASKTFNLAGLQTANIIIPNDQLAQRFRTVMDAPHLVRTNIFGAVATEAAYRHGEDWLVQVLAYLQQNLTFMTRYIENNIKPLKVIPPEGTYLAWIDCSDLGLDSKALEQFMRKQAKVAVDDGYIFGPGGEGFIRINYACPRATLTEGLQRIEKAIHGLR